MPVSRQQIESALSSLLEPERFRDYCPNGLQVEGVERVSKLVSGVTASQALIDAAIDSGADSILVHHGYFWKGEDQAVVGMKRRRLATLLAADVNLFAYHLPLDAHAELGNNAQLARVLDFEIKSVAGDPGLVYIGTCSPVGHDGMLHHLQDRLNRKPLGIAGASEQIERVAWCTGAAQGYIETALLAGADAFITGEVSEQTFHFARETGMHFFSAGHHATERYGVQAVGEHLAERFGIEHQFIDIDNPV